MSGFSTSSETLSTLKTAIENKLDKSITDYTVVKATNNMLNIYQPLEARYNVGRYREYSSSFSMDNTTGVALNTIGIAELTAWVATTSYSVGDIVQDSSLGYVCITAHTSQATLADDSTKWVSYVPLWSETNGFRVYRDAIRPRNELTERRKQEETRGYYITGDGRIYYNQEGGTTVFFEYLKRPTRFSVASDSINMAQLLPTDMEAEEMVEDFVIKRYYTLKGQPAMAQEAEAQFRDQLVAYFKDRPAKLHVFSSI